MMMVDDNKYNKKASSSSCAKKIIAKYQQQLLFFIVIILLFVIVLFQGAASSTPPSFSFSFSSSSSYRMQLTANNNNNNTHGGIQRILYCMTTLSEFDNGKRSTTKGYDRLQSTLIPVLKEGVKSMLKSGYEVDVVLICGYTMTRNYLVRRALPQQVGLQIWDDATPLGYKLEDSDSNYTQEITRGLARQHRYIIKDKLEYYDFFVNFEDDMLIKGETITNYIEITQELQRLRRKAPLSGSDQSRDPTMFYGPLSQKQLSRIMPGFIRVEVLLDSTKYGAQDKLDPVPVTDRPKLDPTPCCQLETAISDTRPGNPESDQLFTWETNVKALGVRKMPLQSNLEWVLMQRGPRMKEPQLRIGDYWSGRDKYFGSESRPDTKAFKFINNQGGWMATRSQIWEWHTQICPGGFLPPFDPGEYNYDGLDMRNVEYWSGGMSLVTKEHGCNLQRIISLDGTRFSRSLLYHTANNKQRQLHGRRQMFVKINDLYGQLTTVVNNAKQEMNRRLQAMNDALHHT